MSFCHLHTHTEYSLLDGSNKIKEYVSRVKELGMDSAAITDHGVMFGVIDFYREARRQGIKAGMIRPITLWPFPKAPLRKAADQVKRFVCVELNMGQMREDVQLAVECKKPVDLCFRVGGMIPSPDEGLDAIRKANEGGND